MNARIQLIGGAISIKWLGDTHLRGVNMDGVRSAMIHGNEDCPEKIELYGRRMPYVTDTPSAVYVLSDGGERTSANPGGFHYVKQ